MDVVVVNDIKYPGNHNEVVESSTFSDLRQPHSSLIATFTRITWLAEKTGMGLSANAPFQSTNV